jgi:signal transduction histidine kinase
MVIEDDGLGFDLEAVRRSRESGLGLFGMEERLALVGGALQVESAIGKGTCVIAEVPLPQRQRR